MYEIYLNFHGLGPPPKHISIDEQQYWLPPEHLTKIIQLAKNYDSAQRKISFTFDDGNKSDVTIALPILLAMGQRASFFLLSDSIGMPGFLGADDIVRLRDAEMTIGSHGAAHVKWSTLNNAELANQIRRSRQFLSSILGQSITTAAAPFGAYNRRVLSILRQNGIETVFTSNGGATRTNAKLKARNTVRMDTPLKVIERLFSDPPMLHLIAGFSRRWVRQLK